MGSSGLVAKTWSRGVLDEVRLESFDRGGLMNRCLAAGDQRRGANQRLCQMWGVGVSHDREPVAANDARKPSHWTIGAFLM